MKNFLKKLLKMMGPDNVPTEDELLQNYRTLTDVAFKNINPNELTPLAKKCYEVEVQNRRRT
jgi:hypothetical protein